MAGKAQIRCINKTPRMDPHLRITSVGGVNQSGSRWKLPLVEAIYFIENNGWTFYVSVDGYLVQVLVASHNGHKYLKTVNDGIQPDNLLALPECP